MAITVSWENEAYHILRWTFEPEWTTADLESAVRASKRLCHSLAGPVDTILDFGGAARVPDNFTGMFGRLARYAAESRMTVVVDAEGFLGVALKVFANDYHTLFFASAVEQAVNLIVRQRAILLDQLAQAARPAWRLPLPGGDGS